MLLFQFFALISCAKKGNQPTYEVENNVLKSVQAKTEKFEIPANIRMIALRAFENSSSALTHVDFSNCIYLSKISKYAFANCSKLTELNLKSCTNLWIICEEAFSQSGIKVVHFPESLMTIEERAFLNTRITILTLPDSVISIGVAAFKDTPIAVINISLSSKLISIQSEAFMNTIITEFYIPKGLVIISTLAFKNTHIKNFTIDPNNRYLAFKDVLYNKNLTQIVAVPPSIPKKIVIPDSVEEILPSAFEYSEVEEIQLANVEIIGNRSFYYSSLKSVVIPSTVRIIGPSAFENCKNLITMQIKCTNVIIGANAFKHTALSCDVLIPVSLIQNAIEEGVPEKSFISCKKKMK